MMESKTNPSTAEIKQAVAAVRDFDYGKPRLALMTVEKLINDTHGKSALRAQIEQELAAVLGSDVSVACKQWVCRQLWRIGTEASVPALEKMLADSDPHVVEAACYALSRHSSPAVGNALRNALGRANGNGLVAVINLLGDRRDAGCAGQLAKLGAGTGDAAEPAMAALGKIATPEAVRVLSGLHAHGEGKRHTSTAHTLLQSAQELAARGEIAAATAVYKQLTAASEPPHIRRGASLALERIQG
jgi:HEAT repeat protein